MLAAAGISQLGTDDVLDQEVALALADAARAIALQHFRRPLDVAMKADASPVTVADRCAEAAMRDILASRRPGDGIFGEELGRKALDAPRIWVLDPIDGTGAFITGSPLFGVLVGLLRDGRPDLGVIEMPALGERWLGRPGLPAEMNGRPCRASGRTRLAEASLAATSLLAMPAADRPAFLRLAERASITRFGGDCYSYGLLASGHLDVVAEAGLQPYDYLPVVAVIEAAGGVVTDWSGAPLGLASNGRVAASASASLHEEVLRVLNA